jgi:peptidoglycan lytic transglycosylase
MPLASVGERNRLRRPVLLGMAIALVVLVAGCHRRRPRVRPTRYPPPTPSAPSPPPVGRAAPPPAPIVQGEEGIASWYGHPFHGRPTASGEIYNMYAMTAAHRTLPFGTQVRVHDLENDQSVVVRITDRGPFVEGRIIDLSYAAAQAMHMSGTALVRLEILGYGSTAAATPPPGTFAVQVGAFQDRRNAEKLKDQISRQYGPVTIQSFDRGDGIFYRVRVGSESSEEDATQLARKLRDAGFATQTFIVRTD